MTYRELLKLTAARLGEGGIASPEAEARELTEHFTGFGRFTPGITVVDDEKENKLNEAVCRRISGIPLQYILGSWTFMDCPLFVGEGVLIPRDDTEVCVRECISRMGSSPRSIIDLCSGSGAIAVALAKKYPGSRVAAVEFSPVAYDYLCRNIKANNALNVTAYHDDITKCASRFPDREADVLISNPPYIRSAEIPGLQKEVQAEPEMALDGGADGLDFYRVISQHWVRKVRPGGIISLEIGEEQAEDVGAMLYSNGVRDIRTIKDIAGLDRTVSGVVQ